MHAVLTSPSRRTVPASRSIAGAFLASRGLVLAVGLLAAFLIGYDPPPVEQAVWRVSSNVVANLPARWDAAWYLDIARHGYRWNPASGEQQNVVFFPLYPMLLRALLPLFGSAALWGGVCISLVAFARALVVLRRVAQIEIGEAKADAAVWLLCAYPFAVFYGAAYTESLFLLAMLSAWLACREQRWIAAAAWGLLVGLTRPNGCLASVAMAALVVWPARHALVAGPTPNDTIRWKQIVRGLAAAAAPIVGMLAYSAYLGVAVGDPWAWVRGQAAWSSLPAQLATTVDDRWHPLVPPRPSDFIVHAGNVAAAVFAIACTKPVVRRLGVPYAAIVVLNIVPPLVAHGPTSIGRFTSVLFPLFLWLAASLPESKVPRWIAGFMAGQAVAAGLFYSWRLLV